MDCINDRSILLYYQLYTNIIQCTLSRLIPYVKEVLGVYRHEFGLTDQIPITYFAFIKYLRKAGVWGDSTLTIFKLHEILGVITAGVFFSRISSRLSYRWHYFRYRKYVCFNESCSRVQRGKWLKRFLLRMVRETEVLYRYCKISFIRKWIIRKSRLTGKLTKVKLTLNRPWTPRGVAEV